MEYVYELFSGWSPEGISLLLDCTEYILYTLPGPMDGSPCSHETDEGPRVQRKQEGSILALGRPGQGQILHPSKPYTIP